SIVGGFLGNAIARVIRGATRGRWGSHRSHVPTTRTLNRVSYPQHSCPVCSDSSVSPRLAVGSPLRAWGLALPCPSGAGASLATVSPPSSPPTLWRGSKASTVKASPVSQSRTPVDHRADPASSILTPETIKSKAYLRAPSDSATVKSSPAPGTNGESVPLLSLHRRRSQSTFGWSKVSRAFEVFVSSRNLYFQLQSPYLRRRRSLSLDMEENEVSTEAVKSEKSRMEVEVSLNNDDERPLKNLPDACPEPEEGEMGVERGSNSESESTLGDVNMEASISTDDVERAGGLGATDDISSFLPVAMDSTDFEASLREAREFEGPQHEISRPGLGWTEPIYFGSLIWWCDLLEVSYRSLKLLRTIPSGESVSLLQDAGMVLVLPTPERSPTCSSRALHPHPGALTGSLRSSYGGQFAVCGGESLFEPEPNGLTFGREEKMVAGSRRMPATKHIAPSWAPYLSRHISMIPLRGSRKRRRMGSEEDGSSSSKDESSEEEEEQE
ncbi:hypothetical protein Taro_020069, partial [Colocasia esculenta]|nr:hypothetical protein [Colocasia esculenta]